MISLAIPYHDSPDTARFISRITKSIDEQTYKDVEILLIKKGRMGETYNECIRQAKGDIIKMMGMDDYFTDKDSLQKIADAFLPEVYWLATGCTHDLGTGPVHYHAPQWRDDLYKGYNSVGGFATISIRNKDIPPLDETLDWMIDCDWYWRINQRHGLPYVLNDPLVIVGIGPHQTTEKLSMDQKKKEWELTTKKYGN
jgi:glycosyltransferase involved in cell wall biosynthesis